MGLKQILISLPRIIFFLACIFLSFLQTTLVSAERETYIVHMDKSFKPESHPTHHHWYSSIVDSLNNGNDPSSSSLLYTYDNAIHGFSARLSPEEVENLKKSPGFVSAYRDRAVEAHTTHSTDFLSLNPTTGLWPASDYGEDIIIGVIDSGVWPESKSFKDHGMTNKIPAKWKGTCEEAGQEFDSSMCNFKLIGARYFNKGAAADPNITISMNSARDTYGHGTHTASTAAGNYVEDVSYFGYAKGTARGVAPRSRVAIYKVLWDKGAGANSDILAGIDQALADGVDVISISISINYKGMPPPLHEDPIAQASFSAMQKGVFFSSSAGNDGPHLGTVKNDVPWVLTVAAGAMDRSYGGTLILGNGQTLVGWTHFPANAIVENLTLIYNKNFSSCSSTKLLLDFSPQGIIICDETWPVIDQIQQVTAAQLPGAIFVSNSSVQLFELGKISCPGVVISPKDGYPVIEYAQSSEKPLVSIKFQQTFLGTQPAPVASNYSSRGPSLKIPNILKPDLMAPGTRILAAYVPTSPAGFIGSKVGLSSNYDLQSGTSMACPHAAGVAAMLKSVHPEWSPAAIRSAMMTTANPLDNTQNPIRDNGNRLEFASPLAIGSGHIDPNRALDPGLVYDATPQDYVNLLCSMNFTKNHILAITRTEAYNCSNPSSGLNYPSFIALYNGQTISSTQKFDRIVTNVGDGAATYKASVIAPAGSEVVVSPDSLVFGKKYEKQRYSLTIKYGSNKQGKESFGEIV
ncbi:subtilisin-like protease SBT3 [Ziziphus jujuba]|uniref:Subtilisin-like protease SBT3 n=1 Tax=Ziziphus jujuba TaxID=326968 RepID=A0A6P3ZKK7_ZIZJJ|nr:subtilisin-like protease SBT3 [Ziziphus jujuba]